MQALKSLLHYYLREKLWRSAINVCTDVIINYIYYYLLYLTNNRNLKKAKMLMYLFGGQSLISWKVQ